VSAATHFDLEQARRSVRKTQWLKGGKMLWSDFSHVRDIAFNGFRPVRLPRHDGAAVARRFLT
jgi:uncharacterized protein